MQFYWSDLTVNENILKPNQLPSNDNQSESKNVRLITFRTYVLNFV